MNQIIRDFFQLGLLRLLARGLMGIRGLVIITSLTPLELGEYTILLLFIFYVSILDLGSLAGLERDLPHYQGAGDLKEYKKTGNVGWSAFFSLSLFSSVFLGILIFCVYKDPTLALLLMIYLITDKIYRAFEANSRIEMNYCQNGIAQFILGMISLAGVWLALPVFRIYGIFIGFIGGFILSSCFLRVYQKIQFKWCFDWALCQRFVFRAIPLSLILYGIELFHAVALTVLAVYWDKETLGYFAFAFRIFYICLILFPYLIQEVFRTRMYYIIAKDKQKNDLEELYFPMGLYSLIVSCFWLCVYWWGDAVIFKFVSVYAKSAITLKILLLSLLPLGICKVLGDYLSSNKHNQMKLVIVSWALGIGIQGMTFFAISIYKLDLLVVAPTIYLMAAFFVFYMIGIAAFKNCNGRIEGFIRLTFFLFPIALVTGCLGFLGLKLGIYPSLGFFDNFKSFFASLFGVGLLSCLCLYALRNFSGFKGIFFLSDKRGV